LHCQLDGVFRGIQERHPAIGKFRDDFRLEQHVETIDRCIRHPRLDHVHVVREAIDGMQIWHRMRVARVVRGLNGENARIEIVPIWQPGFVQNLVDARLDLAAEKIGRSAHHIVSRAARQQARLHGLLGIIDIVDHFDAGELLELLDGVGTDKIGPIIDE
jgi:hypothetical protein